MKKNYTVCFCTAEKRIALLYLRKEAYKISNLNLGALLFAVAFI